ncbi:DUF6580 family putative transport protein [Chryseolinea lacunae]|uniref:Uncharacterized protein n=1 Tax=Chryseolinea lacunae TaxID=2801331 RepID=A0ABS1KNH3_9BACT|nr:DUF6580 family putative transport protein [Chryseolinea lacunae]MBL0741010.1 hypothetical protein [Chryseolinea lacunae]
MNKLNPRPLVLAAIIVAVGIFRIATSSMHSPLAGFTPLGAMALFAGFYFEDKWKAYLLPLLTLWLSDIVLNRFVYLGEWMLFYDSFAWVYGSFALMVTIGQLFKEATVRNVALAAVITTVTHALISNFGVWLVGCTGTAEDIQYTPDLSGLFQCYAMGLPYMGNFLIGNLVFSAILFGGFEWMKRAFPKLQHA